AIISSVTNGAGTDLIQFSPTIDGGTIGLADFFVNPLATGVGPSAYNISNSTTLVIDGETGLTQGITITCNGPTPFRIFYVDATSNLTLQGLTLSAGNAPGFAGGNAKIGGAGGGGAGMGGAIFNQGTLTIQDSTLSGNTAHGGAGGSFQSGLSSVYGGAGGGGMGSVGTTVTSDNGAFGGGIN